MKTLLVLSTAFLTGGLFFQMPTTPPMKMGLWETTSTVKMSGAALPGGMKLPGSTVKVRACMTPESYAKNLGAAQNQQDCTRSNEKWTLKGYSFDLACKRGNATGHADITFEGMEAAHSVIHLSMNMGSGSMDMDSTADAHFVSADCGAITPDKPVVSR
jgi:hypothetical protein